MERQGAQWSNATAGVVGGGLIVSTRERRESKVTNDLWGWEGSASDDY